jgi:branched-chain amino acid aminotransferase
MGGEEGENVKWIVNGNVTGTAAGLSFQDRGALLGDGLFETFRVEQGVPLFLQQHLDRLLEGARILRFAHVPAREEWTAAIRQAIARNGITEGYLRLTLTRGMGAFNRPLEECTQPTWWVETRPHRLDSAIRERGVTAILASSRLNPDSPLRRVKSLNYLENILAKQEAWDRGAGEALFLTVEGDVAEGTSANLFVVKREILYTPSLDRGALPGIVRRWVLETAACEGLQVQERRVMREELTQADELFFTNSTWGPFPCVAVDDTPVKDGRPGPHTRRWMKCWQKELNDQIEAEKSDGMKLP